MRHPLSAFAQRKIPGMPGCGMWLLWVVTCGVGLIIYIIYYSRVVSKIQKQNECDYNASIDLNKELSQLSIHRPTIMGDTSNIRVFRKYLVGEVTRHFDSQTNSQITGWLDHNLSVVGWGVGARVGSTSLGIGQVGFIGKSDVHLDSAGTARDNLLGDGFVAVLEEKPLSGKSDIVRVAVPSEPAAREYIASLLLAFGKVFGEESYRDIAFKENITALQSAAHNDVSYVSDRLSSILRMSPDRRPSVTVVGSEMTEHAILGSAIQFEDDQRWYQLFPVGLITKIIEIASINARNVPVFQGSGKTGDSEQRAGSLQGK
jgi:hypothetical protein